MKKLFKLLVLSALFAAVFLSPLCADSKNIVFYQTYDILEIESLDFSLTYENLQITHIYGDEIVVEIGTNNIKKFPEVFTEDNTLKIKSKEQKAKRGDKCTVYVYLPQDFYSMGITINNVSGNISADILKAQNGVVINNVSGRTDINACQTELFTVGSVSGNITLQKVAVDYFEFSETSGNLFAELEQAPQATSMMANISGKTQLYYPKTSNFEIIAFTISGSIKSSGSDKNNDGASYHMTIGSGGPQLSITSVSGKIEMVEF